MNVRHALVYVNGDNVSVWQWDSYGTGKNDSYAALFKKLDREEIFDSIPGSASDPVISSLSTMAKAGNGSAAEALIIYARSSGKLPPTIMIREVRVEEA